MSERAVLTTAMSSISIAVARHTATSVQRCAAVIDGRGGAMPLRRGGSMVVDTAAPPVTWLKAVAWSRAKAAMSVPGPPVTSRTVSLVAGELAEADQLEDSLEVHGGATAARRRRRSAGRASSGVRST